MLYESAKTMRRRKNLAGAAPQAASAHLGARAAVKMRFRRSKLYISALLPFTVGFLVGVLAAIMGVGGGFVMVPAMIYLLGMRPTW